MRLTIPDDLADEILQRMPTARKTPPLEDIICRILRQALPLVEEGGLALTRDEAATLAEILLRPSFASGGDIIGAARDLHDLQIGRHRLKLDPSVLNELRSRATREGKDFGQVLQQTVDRIGQEVGGLL